MPTQRNMAWSFDYKKVIPCYFRLLSPMIVLPFLRFPSSWPDSGRTPVGMGQVAASPQLLLGGKVWDNVQGEEREAAVQGFIVKWPWFDRHVLRFQQMLWERKQQPRRSAGISDDMQTFFFCLFFFNYMGGGRGESSQFPWQQCLHLSVIRYHPLPVSKFLNQSEKCL